MSVSNRIYAVVLYIFKIIHRNDRTFVFWKLNYYCYYRYIIVIILVSIVRKIYNSSSQYNSCYITFVQTD